MKLSFKSEEKKSNSKNQRVEQWLAEAEGRERGAYWSKSTNFGFKINKSWVSNNQFGARVNSTVLYT